MASQIIYTDKESIKESLKTINELVNTINHYTNLFNEKGINLYVNKLANKKEYIQEIYLDKLFQICEDFGVTHKFDEIKCWEYRVTETPMYSDIAHGKTSKVIEAINQINISYMRANFIDEKYITITNNIATVNKDIEKILLEDNSIYTENQKQNEALSKLNKICKLMHEFNKEFNVSPCRMFNFDNNINVELFLQSIK